jgi:hypothetical protein
MQPRLFRLVSRLLLAVMLATFLAPSFAIGLVGTHEQLEHSIAALAGAEISAHDHIDVQQTAQHEHADPHSFSGHVLAHMPMAVSDALSILVRQPNTSVLSEPQIHIPLAIPDMPFRPPRSLLWA